MRLYRDSGWDSPYLDGLVYIQACSIVFKEAQRRQDSYGDVVLPVPMLAVLWYMDGVVRLFPDERISPILTYLCEKYSMHSDVGSCRGIPLRVHGSFYCQ